MRDTWGMPGAQAFMSKPTTAHEAAEAMAAQRRTAYGTVEEIHAQREQEARVLRERHAWMLASATDPILRALVEAHGPSSDAMYPECGECPAPPSEYTADPEPTSWPCPVWEFISERMDGAS